MLMAFPLQMQVANASFGGLLGFDDFVRVISHYHPQQLWLEDKQHTVDRLVLTSGGSDARQLDADDDGGQSCFSLQPVPEEVAVLALGH
jgi:hypothetical protein